MPKHEEQGQKKYPDSLWYKEKEDKREKEYNLQISGKGRRERKRYGISSLTSFGDFVRGHPTIISLRRG